MIFSILSIICILIGFWLGKGCPLPYRNNINTSKTETKPTEIDEETKRKQDDLDRQWQELLNYSGCVGKGGTC